jgi:hypothetical protein
VAVSFIGEGNRDRVTRSLVLCVCFVDSVCPFGLFLLTIVFSVLLRYAASDCPFGMFKLLFDTTMRKQTQITHYIQ